MRFRPTAAAAACWRVEPDSSQDDPRKVAARDIGRLMTDYKDVKVLARAAADAGCPLELLAALEAVNERQKLMLVDKIVQRFGDDLGGKTIAP